MSINLNYVIPITDERGKALVHNRTEPEPGSIALTNGETGTCWQRFASDGLWHSTRGGRARDWRWMLNQRNVVLVYDAPARVNGDQ